MLLASAITSPPWCLLCAHVVFCLYYSHFTEHSLQSEYEEANEEGLHHHGKGPVVK